MKNVVLRLLVNESFEIRAWDNTCARHSLSLTGAQLEAINLVRLRKGNRVGVPNRTGKIP